jgi:hypothetical protein
MRTTPLLVLAYNRPDKVQNLIDQLRPQAPKNLMIAVDGPKPGNATDAARVEAVHRVIETIDWTDRVETRLRPVNLGLRVAVVDAVNWAMERHGQAIIIEEDVLPGPNLAPYAEHMLDHYRDDSRIEHISGYNAVPPGMFSGGPNDNRLTLYPQSIAWATWDRAWKNFDGSLDWALNVSVNDLTKLTGSRFAALRWKQNFGDAAADRISTWAYRWISSMWSRGALCLSSNRSLVTYAGYDEGTNSFLKAAWSELPRYDGDSSVLLGTDATRDPKADRWVSETVFAGTPFGVTRGVAITAALAARKRLRRAQAKRRESGSA